MDTKAPTSDLSESINNQGDNGTPQPPAYKDDRDLSSNFDFNSQFAAIRDFLQWNHDLEEANAANIQHAGEHAQHLDGIQNECAVNYHTSLLHESIYKDAAHSMAAVGMLAPFLETVFSQHFREIGRRWPTETIATKPHERWQSTHAVKWDCHIIIEDGRVKTDLTKGILELSEATGLSEHFPDDLGQTLSALFGYRNKMFHCGFEWPMNERLAFQRRINRGTWPTTWFKFATSDTTPWVCYMTHDFIVHCLNTADLVLKTFNSFLSNEQTRSMPEIKPSSPQQILVK